MSNEDEWLIAPGAEFEQVGCRGDFGAGGIQVSVALQKYGRPAWMDTPSFKHDLAEKTWAILLGGI